MAFSAEPSDVLLTIAEVAVTFAGFASVVAIFQVRWTRSEVPFDLFRFWVMLAFSLATLLFALLPVLLHFLGLRDSAMWRLSSALLAFFVLANAVFIAQLIRRRVETVVASLSRALSVGANLTYSVILASQAMNLFGLFGGPRFGFYLLGLLLLLLAAGVNFVRLVWIASSSMGRTAA